MLLQPSGFLFHGRKKPRPSCFLHTCKSLSIILSMFSSIQDTGWRWEHPHRQLWSGISSVLSEVPGGFERFYKVTAACQKSQNWESTEVLTICCPSGGCCVTRDPLKCVSDIQHSQNKSTPQEGVWETALTRWKNLCLLGEFPSLKNKSGSL